MSRSTSSTRSRFLGVLFVLALAAVGVAGLAGTASAGSLYWSGAGTWDDGNTPKWGIASNGPYDANWIGASDAHFEGTGGWVTVAPAGIASVGSINFDANSYTIAGGTIKLTGIGGNITAGAGADTINSIIDGAVGLTKLGTGALTLGGVNSYTGATTISAGTLALGSAGTIANSATITVGDAGSSGAVLDLTAKGGFNILSGQTLKGIGTVNIGASKTVTVDANGHWAPGNSIGTNAVTGNLTLSGISDFELGTPGANHVTPGISDRTDVSGTLTLGGTLNLIDNAGANGQGSAGAGSYKIFTQASTAGSPFTTINNIAGYHAKVDTADSNSVYLDNYQIAAANIPTPVALTNVHVGGAFGTSPLNITNTASTVLSEGLNANKGAVTGDASVGGTNITNLAGGASSTAISVGLGLADTSTAGLRTGTVTIGLESNGANSGYANTALDSQVITVNGKVYDYAAANVLATPVSLGYIHKNLTGIFVPLVISNTVVGDPNFIEGLNATAWLDANTSIGNALVGGTNVVNLAGGSSSRTILVGLNTAKPGARSGTVTIDFASNGANSGLANTALAPQVITLTGQAYTGLSTWKAGVSSGSWGTIAGTGAGAFGLNWGVNEGSPGLDPNFTGVDTATFGNTSGSVTVNLDGAAPNLNKVTFNGTGSYTVAQGNDANTGLTLAGTTPIITAVGTQVISAPVALATNTSVAVTNALDSLTISGIISGTGLTKSGAGTLTLTAANSYTGTTVNAGTLALSGSGTLGVTTGALTADGSTAIVDLGTTIQTVGVVSLKNGAQINSTTGTLTGTSYALESGSIGAIIAGGTPTKTTAGTVTLSGNNTYTGVTTITQGALRISDPNGLGTIAGNTVVSPSGAALQIDGGVAGWSLAEPLTLSGSGINTGGALQNLFGSGISSGANTVSSAISLGAAATIGADSGSTLNITGGIAAGTSALTFAGAGSISVGTTAITGTTATQTKIGSGTLTITNADPLTGNIAVNAGTLALNAAGTTAGNVFIAPAATLSMTDNSVAPTNNRLGGATKTLSLNAGILNFTGSTAGNSLETTGALTVLGGQSVVTVTAQTGMQADLNFNAATVRNATQGGTVLFRGSGLGTAAGAGIATIKSGTGGFTFIGQTGAVGTTNKGIIPWAIVDANTTTGLGTSFATADTATGILRPLKLPTDPTPEMVSNAYTANTNVLLTGTVAAPSAANTTINSLTINTGGAVTITPTATAATRLSIGSGGLLATASSSITGGQLAPSGQFDVFTPGASTVLTISSAVTDASGFAKAGAGTLELNSVSGAYSGYSTNTIGGGNNNPQNYINEGVVKLGASNALLLGHFGVSVYAGATLDLNGNMQYMGSISSQNVTNPAGYVPGVITADGTADATTAGLVKSSTGGGTLYMTVQNSGATNQYAFSGSIQGANVGIARVGEATVDALILRGVNTYGGPTLIAGGTTTAAGYTLVRDDGRITGTSRIDINYAGFAIDNTGLSNHPDRVNNADIGLRGGALYFLGRAATASTETLGAVTLVQGHSVINVTSGGTGVNSADLTLTSLARTAGASATAVFDGTNLGQTGSGSRRININGATPASLTAAGLMVNNIMPWAVIGNGPGNYVASDFASYIPYTTVNGVTSGGIGAMGNTAAGYLAYDGTAIPGSDQPTYNIKVSNPVITSSIKLNSLNLNGSGITFSTGTEVLNLTSGGLLSGQNNGAIGATVDSGRIAAGGTDANSTTHDLYIYQVNNGVKQLNSRIIDTSDPLTGVGGSGKTRLVLYGGDAISMTNAANSYTGGIVISGPRLDLNNTVSGVVIPNATTAADGLVINGSRVNMNNSSGQIGSGNIVTLNGSSILSLFGDNTLEGLVINSIGGNANGQTPSVNTFTAGNNTGSSGTLTLGTSGITTTSMVMPVNQVNPTILGRVNLASTTTLNIGATKFNGQIVQPFLPDFTLQGLAGGGGTITKSGDGVLQFTTASIITGTLDVTGGTIQVGAAGAGARFANVNLASGARMNVLLDSLYGSLGGSGMVTNSGTTTRTLTVGFSDANSTFSGSFLHHTNVQMLPVNLSKIGTGTMRMTGNTSTANGTLTVNRGGVTYQDGGKSNFLNSVVVNPGATLTLDNVIGTSVDSRLQGGALTLSGGTLVFKGTGTIENAGALNTNAGMGVINVSGTGTLSFASLVNHPSGGVVNFTGSGPAVQIVGTTSIVGGILVNGSGSGSAAYFFNGTDFATSTGLANAAITQYTGYNTSTIAAAAATDNMNPAASEILNSSKTINTLKLTSGAGVTLRPGVNLTLTSGGIINDGGGNLTGGTLQVSGNNELNINTTGAMTIGSVLQGSNNRWVKVGAGNLTLSVAQNNDATIVNEGTLTLAGGNNTLTSKNGLLVNGGSTVVDFVGTSLYVPTLTSTGSLPGSGGIVTGAGGTFTTRTGGTFAGKIQGTLNLVLGGGGTQTLVDDSSTVGTVTVQNGLTLRDSGKLSGATAVNVNYGTLTIDQSGLNPAGSLNPTRIAAAVPLNLSGGTLVLTPGGSVDSSATFDTVNVLNGANTIQATVLNNTGTTNTLTIGNLVRSAGSGSTVNFPGAIGQFGLNQARVLLSGINGVAPVNGAFLGPWAVVNSGDFATYLNGTSPVTPAPQGVGAYGTTGFPGYGAALTTGTIANITAASTAIAANTAVGALRLGLGGTQDITFTLGTEVLNIETGALLRSNNNNTTTIGTVAKPGILTAGATVAGTTELVAYAQNAWTINSIIKDGKDTGFAGANAGAVVSLVKSGAGTLTLTAANTYTGGTVVDQGTLTFTGALGTVIPGNLTINNATVTETALGQIAATSVVTLNGGSTLTMIGANTLAGIAFNSIGGSGATPTVATGGVLTLAGTGNISSTPTNYNAAPTITGTLDLGATTTHNITVNAGIGNYNGLTMTALVQNGGFTKNGEGVLFLNNTANAFGNINITAGAITLGQGSADASLGTLGNTVTLNGATAALWLRNNNINTHNIVVGASGGTLACEGGRTTLMPISLTGTLTASTIDPIGASWNNSASSTFTLSGPITGLGSMNITGNPNFADTLVLNNGTNNYSGGTTVSAGGRLRAVAGGLGDPNGSLTVNTGGTFILNNTNQSVGKLAGNGGTIVNNQNSPGTLIVGNGDATGGNYQGILADKEPWSGNTSTLALTKVGTGTQTLTGVNTYTGDTTVNAGTLNLADNAGLKFVIGASGVNNWITGTGTVSLAGDFTFDLTAAGVTSGNTWTIVNNATLAETFTSTFTVSGFKPDSGGILWSKPIPSSTKVYEFSESTGILMVKLGGDTNLDGVVDAADYIALKRNFGTTSGATWSMGNFDGGSGTVDWADLQILMTNFGAGSGGAPAPATTPEPGSVMLLLFGTAALLRRRRAIVGRTSR